MRCKARPGSSDFDLELSRRTVFEVFDFNRVPTFRQLNCCCFDLLAVFLPEFEHTLSINEEVEPADCKDREDVVSYNFDFGVSDRFKLILAGGILAHA